MFFLFLVKVTFSLCLIRKLGQAGVYDDTVVIEELNQMFQLHLK